MKITYSVLLKGSIEMCGPSVQFTLTRQRQSGNPTSGKSTSCKNRIARGAIHCRRLPHLNKVVSRATSIVHVYIAQYGARIIRELPSEDASFVKKLLQPSELTFLTLINLFELEGEIFSTFLTIF